MRNEVNRSTRLDAESSITEAMLLASVPT